MFLAATCPLQGDQPERLNSLLDYIEGGRPADELQRRVDERVRQVIGSSEWRREYMMMALRDQDNVNKGIRIGLEKGKLEGENRMGALVAKLLEAGRNEDAALASTDPDARERFMQELGIE